jgi:hypothetical protein
MPDELNALIRPFRGETCKSSWIFVDPNPARISRCRAHGGNGVFAERNVAKGECIFRETPLATWRVRADATNAEKVESFAAMSAALSVPTVEAIMQLSQSPRHSSGHKRSLLGTWQTNGLPINYESVSRPGTTNSQLASMKEAAVFASICRLNHACIPNAYAEWNGQLGCETVHALRDIPMGHEVTISYLPPGGMERHLRQAWLQDEHGFACGCARCSLTGEALEKSEARQRAVGRLFLPGEAKLPVLELTRRLDLRLELMAQEGMPPVWAWKPMLFYLAQASLADVRDDPSAERLQRAAALAERARSVMRDALGADHPATAYASAWLQQVVSPC